MFNWRIVLGGAAATAVLTAGVAAPAFAAPRASSPVPLNGITQSLSGSRAGGIFCALPGLNSLSGAIPNLSNAASVVPDVGNAAGSVTSGNSSVTGAVSNLVPGNGEGGLKSVSNAVGGITGGLSGGQNGGPATGPLP